MSISILSKSTITQPGEGMWLCCQQHPAGVVSFADGTAVKACGPCLGTVAPRYRHPMPPVPCLRCGHQYPAEVLAQADRGEVTLDPLPTHLCEPQGNGCTLSVACAEGTRLCMVHRPKITCRICLRLGTGIAEGQADHDLRHLLDTKTREPLCAYVD